MDNSILEEYCDTRGIYMDEDLIITLPYDAKDIVYSLDNRYKSTKPLVPKRLMLRKHWEQFKLRRRKWSNRHRRYRASMLRKRVLIQGVYRVVKVAKVFVSITTNNTHVTITAVDKHSIKRSVMCSAGCIRGIKGTKRSSPLATEIVIKRALFILKKVNKHARILQLYRSGVGRSRSVVRKTIIAARMKIQLIREVTAIPHNGTRKSARRRV